MGLVIGSQGTGKRGKMHELKERTYTNAAGTRVVASDETLAVGEGRVLLGNAGTKIPDEQAKALGLKRSKTDKPANEASGDGDSNETESDDSKTGTEDKAGSSPESTDATGDGFPLHKGGGYYTLSDGSTVKGSEEAEAAEAALKSD